MRITWDNVYNVLAWDLAHSKCSANVSNSQGALESGKESLKVTKVNYDTKTTHWTSSKLNVFCTSKDTNKKVKRNPKEWEKYLKTIYLIRV